MKKIILSAVVATSIVSATELTKIEVTENINDELVGEISTSEIKNADLAEALAKKSTSISMIRRSGIANDIVLRGQKRDNIKVTIDDAVVHGACPNRMDPPTSHVITSNVDSVVISEGPFDVEEFGTLSGGVKIKTVQPTKELSGSVGVTAGSYGYKKGEVSVSGGNDTIQALVTYTQEEADQYIDGHGKTLAEQTKIAVSNTGAAGTRYAQDNEDIKSFEKQSLMVKAVAQIDDKSAISVSATQNKSDNILYPSSKMDAAYDDSNIYTVNYTVNELSKYSNKLEVKAYKSDVAHPMDNSLRVSGATTYMTNELTTDAVGIKVINSFDAMNRSFKVGFDSSSRNWDGEYYTSTGGDLGKSIDDVDTKNKAVFLKCENKVSKTLKLNLGLRYDDTSITTPSEENNDYSGLSGSIIATLTPNSATKYFVGIGQSNRVPDARELYNLGKKANPAATTQAQLGTPDLDQVTNKEIDFGAEHTYESVKVKASAFYSDLTNYIYYKKVNTPNKFENIDATIYGFDLATSYYMDDQFTFDAGYSYKIGKKDKALDGQTDKDLADITPPKTTLSATYNYNSNHMAKVDFINVAKWSKYDSDNGEQAIDGYNVVNVKSQSTIAKNFELTLGVDNLFGETYAVSNTYSDLILLTDGTTGDVVLLNEPGRYFYGSVKYKF
jgi:iron complex outermembrane receptor protein